MAEESEHRGGVRGVISRVAAGEGVGGSKEIAERGGRGDRHE
jgi:hypothetical protein